MRLLPLFLALAACGADTPDSPASSEPQGSDKPRLALLTSLPLLFDEGFSLESSGSPALAALEQDFVVEPIAIADAASLEGHDLLLMAHAPAQTAEALVDLDGWVRDGGRVLLLADPRLAYRSSLPLGDNRRPLSEFPDTGLLAHWGVDLVGPIFDDPPAQSGEDVFFGSVGRGAFAVTKPECRLGDFHWQQPGFLAICDLGKGQARLMADADFLMMALDPDAGRARVAFPTELSTGLPTVCRALTMPFRTPKKAQKTAKSRKIP